MILINIEKLLSHYIYENNSIISIWYIAKRIKSEDEIVDSVERIVYSEERKAQNEKP